MPSNDTLKNKGGHVGLAVLIITLGGGNVAQTREGVQETRKLREDVQQLATEVTLLNWRVTNLEGVEHGQGT